MEKIHSVRIRTQNKNEKQQETRKRTNQTTNLVGSQTFAIPIALAFTSSGGSVRNLLTLPFCSRNYVRVFIWDVWRPDNLRLRNWLGSGRSSYGRSAPPSERLELKLESLTSGALFFPHALNLLKLILKITHGLIHQQFLQCPFLDIPSFVLFQMMNILNRASKDCTLGFFSIPTWNYSAKLVDAFVDVAATPAFDFFLFSRSWDIVEPLRHKSTYMIILPLPRPLIASHRRVPAATTTCCNGCRGRPNSLISVVRATGNSLNKLCCLLQLLDTSFIADWALWSRRLRSCGCRLKGNGTQLTKIGRSTRMRRRAWVIDTWKTRGCALWWILGSTRAKNSKIRQNLCRIFLRVAFIQLVEKDQSMRQKVSSKNKLKKRQYWCLPVTCMRCARAHRRESRTKYDHV